MNVHKDRHLSLSLVKHIVMCCKEGQRLILIYVMCMFLVTWPSVLTSSNVVITRHVQQSLNYVSVKRYHPLQTVNLFRNGQTQYLPLLKTKTFPPMLIFGMGAAKSLHIFTSSHLSASAGNNLRNVEQILELFYLQVKLKVK